MFDRRCAETQARNLTSAAIWQHRCLRPVFAGLFLSDKSTEEDAEKVWSSSGVHSIKIRDSHAPGLALQKSWLWLADATSNHSKHILRFARLP